MQQMQSDLSVLHEIGSDLEQSARIVKSRRAAATPKSLRATVSPNSNRSFENLENVEDYRTPLVNDDIYNPIKRRPSLKDKSMSKKKKKRKVAFKTK